MNDEHGFKHPCFDPALDLLVNRPPRWQIMRGHPPGGSCPHQSAQPVEHLTQAVIALGSLFGHQGQIRSHEAPLLITDITRISFSFHAWSLPSPGEKFITPSR